MTVDTINGSSQQIQLPTTASSATTATQLDGYYTTFHYNNPTAGGLLGNVCIPVISSDGGMEVGKYIDFHTSSTLQDFATRIICTA